jgi:chromosome segregation ATPase
LEKQALIMKDTISKIEERIRSAGALKEENRAELLDLLGQLRSQIGALSETNREQAQSIAGFTEVSAHEATREEKNASSLQHSILGLESSVQDLEGSHPQLVEVVNRIAAMLANMGI